VIVIESSFQENHSKTGTALLFCLEMRWPVFRAIFLAEQQIAKIKATAVFLWPGMYISQTTFNFRPGSQDLVSVAHAEIISANP